VSRLGSRRHLLRSISSALALFGIGPARAATPDATLPGTADRPAPGKVIGTLREVPLRDVQRVDAAEKDGWWARDGAGRLWHVAANAGTEQVADGLAPTGGLATGHGRVAGRGLDGRLWVHDTTRPTAPPSRSEVTLAPHGGLCILPLAIIAVVAQASGHVLARFEADARGQWQVVARSREPVLPDAVPVAVDLDGRDGGAHIAVLAGPDAKRYPHAVLGDDIEATRVLWLERHSLEPLRSLHLDGRAVFEDRLLRPWALPDGRTGLVTMQSGPSGAQLVVVAASPNEPSKLELAAAGPAIGTRKRWLSPASVIPAHGEIWAVHTPHIGGVLHRYRAKGSALVTERMAIGLTNHRLGARDLDISARVGPWLLLPMQDWRRAGAFDTTSASVREAPPLGAPILQCVASAHRDSAILLTESRVAIWTP
jgi:hypothetical protein